MFLRAWGHCVADGLRVRAAANQMRRMTLQPFRSLARTGMAAMTAPCY
jgi:hypothetical protein